MATPNMAPHCRWARISPAMVFGSLSGIIMVERAKVYGFTISFSEFSRAGAVVTVLTMAMAAVWLLVV